MTTTTARYFDEINIGMCGEFNNIVKEEDIIQFAEITGDRNPIHLDANYARTSIFGQRISHGMLVAGFISAVFGYKFPGPGWIYVSQSLQFKAPVFIGDQTTTLVTVEKLIPEKKMVKFKTLVSVKEKIVITGSATLLSPKREN
jgi:3-hydroxybutyryl-CoA dehydratase